MTDVISETTDEAARRSFDVRISRLAQYRPFDDGGTGLGACLTELTIVAAMENGGRFESLAECREAFVILWDYEVEIDELRTVVDTLVAHSSARRIGGGFALTPTFQIKLREDAADATELEAHAFNAWRTALLRRWPELQTEDFSLLCIDFSAWLGQVVAHHGAEAALLIYTEEPRTRALLKRLDAMGLDFLPARNGLLADIREAAFQMFVREAGENQRSYLARRLNIGFYLTVLTVDPHAGAAIREKVKGHRVYLDTNFLYAILGMARAGEVYAAERLLALTKDMGFELAVTSWTLEELRTSVAKSRRNLERMALPRRELANLMLKGTTEKGFERAFWMHYRDKGTRPKDFFDRVSHIEGLLRSHGINTVDAGCSDIISNGRLIGEHVALYDRVMESQDKDEVVVEHDVRHRLLIEKLRGDGHLTFTNARYWFLTQHARLMRYGAVDSAGDVVHLPFCVTASAWAQAIRFLTPRTQDVEQMVVDLFSSPYVGYRSPVNAVAVAAVVSRIDEFADVDIELGAEVLADGALVHDIGAADTADEAVEHVKLALDTKAEQLRERARLSGQREMEARQKQDDAEKRAASAEADTAEAIREHDRLLEELALHKQREAKLSSSIEAERDTWASQRTTFSEAVAAERSQREDTDRKVAALEQQARDVIRHRQVLTSVASIIALVAAAVAVVASGTISGAWPTTGVAVGLLAGVWFVLLYAMGRKQAGKAILTGLALVGGVMAIYAAAAAITGGASGGNRPGERTLPTKAPPRRR